MKSKIVRFLDYIKYFFYPKKYGFKIPLFSGVGTANLLNHELWLDDLLRYILTFDKLIIDVGANVGQTLLKIKEINKDVPYMGFEPNPTCLFYLEELIKINQLRNCEIAPIGISNESGLMTLFINSKDESDSSASIVSGFREKAREGSKKHIACLSYKDFGDKVINKQVSLVKIDVEGAESYVLDSIQELIFKDKPIILCEILPVYDEKVNKERLKRQIQIEKLMEKLNYFMYRVDKEGMGRLNGLRKIDSVGVHGDLNLCEYVFAHKEELKLKSIIIE